MTYFKVEKITEPAIADKRTQSSAAPLWKDRLDPKFCLIKELAYRIHPSAAEPKSSAGKRYQQTTI